MRGGTSEEGESEEDESEEEKDTPIVSQKKGPAWTDPDDPALEVSLAGDKRRRKLRDAVSEDVVGGREYERRLRRQFENINPTPDWASAARKKLHPSKAKRRRPSTSSASESDDQDALPDVLADAKGILHYGRKPGTLPHGRLDIERLRDANLAARTEGEVKAVQFHPSPDVPVLMVAGTDRRLKLFNVWSPTCFDCRRYSYDAIIRLMGTQTRICRPSTYQSSLSRTQCSTLAALPSS